MWEVLLTNASKAKSLTFSITSSQLYRFLSHSLDKFFYSTVAFLYLLEDTNSTLKLGNLKFDEL